MRFAKAARLSACLALIIAVSPAFAASATGRIAKYRLDIHPQEPAVCIQLEPPISGKDWACLNNRNMFPAQTPNGAVYIEPCPYMSEVIQDAYLSKKVCTVSWEFVDLHGYAMIAAIECTQ